MTNYQFDESENKFDIFTYDAHRNCDFAQFDNKTGPCLGYDGYYASKMYVRNIKRFYF